MRGHEISSARDHYIFRRTAERTRIVNISPTVPRGGIRL